jgi:voltage-gated potassium channel
MNEVQWSKAADWPLTIAALAFLTAYAVPILVPSLPAPWPQVADVTAQGCWAIFLVDYAVRALLTHDRRRFVLHHIPDLVILVLPLLRPLRLLRLVTLLSFLNRRAGDNLRGRVATYVAGSTVLVLFVASLAVLDAERRAPKASITTFGDALWWAVTTVTTVGYGDRYPITTEGRLVAVALMLSGIALIGVVTASVAAWLLGRIQEVEERTEQVTRQDLRSLADEVRQLRAELATLRGRTDEVVTDR